MTKIVIDTNIIFSAFLNINSRIGQMLLSIGHYDFYAPDYIRIEVIKHKQKIKKIAHISENEFLELYELIMKNITVLHHTLIPGETYKKAKLLCENIDIDDTAFVAVTEFLKGNLWTGDMKLLKGLSGKGYKQLILTDELFQDLLKKERGKK